MAIRSQTQVGYALIVPLGVGITQASAGNPITNWSSQDTITDWDAFTVTASGQGGTSAPD